MGTMDPLVASQVSIVSQKVNIIQVARRPRAVQTNFTTSVEARDSKAKNAAPLVLSVGQLTSTTACANPVPTRLMHSVVAKDGRVQLAAQLGLSAKEQMSITCSVNQKKPLFEKPELHRSFCFWRMFLQVALKQLVRSVFFCRLAASPPELH